MFISLASALLYGICQTSLNNVTMGARTAQRLATLCGLSHASRATPELFYEATHG